MMNPNPNGQIIISLSRTKYAPTSNQPKAFFLSIFYTFPNLLSLEYHLCQQVICFRMLLFHQRENGLRCPVMAGRSFAWLRLV